MSYEKAKKYVGFHAKDFVNPLPLYYPGYFWFWNDLVDKGILIKQLRDMHKNKALSVCPHPMPPEFRPGSMNTLMKPGYLTKEYLDFYKSAITEARRLKMDVWLYDEGGWPSGSACGRVVKSDNSLAQQVLECDGDTYTAKSIPLYYPVGGSTGIRYPDLFKPEAVKQFIKLTHEAYKKAVGKYFKNTINITFTDEPSVSPVIPGKQIPWTDNMLEEFRREKGYDLTEYFPALFAERLKIKSVKNMQARIDFFDFWSRQFTENYFNRIRKWCSFNGLLSGGHLGGEDETLGSAYYGYGHILRTLRAFDVPGVDAIWRQIFPGKENHHFPKYASTVAHQQNKPWAFTESFGVYGNGLTLEQMKWITDYQYVRGINRMIIIGYSLSTRNHLMAGLRPHFGPVNPLWKYIEKYHSYTARLGYLLSSGKPVIREAVYYPVRDLWAGGKKMEKTAGSNDRLVKLLLENQCDFDFIDDDILESPSTKITKGALKVGNMEYNTIWISRTEWISEKSMKKLAIFSSKGGKVNSIDSLPKSGGGKGENPGNIFNVFSSDKEMVEHMNPLIRVIPECKTLRVCCRSLKNAVLYFITNEGESGIEVDVRFNEKMIPVRLDPESGKCWALDNISKLNGSCFLPVTLPFAGSCVFLFTKKKVSLISAPLVPGSVLLNLNNGWKCRPVRSFEAGKHDFVIKILKKKAVPVQLGDWRKILGKDFSGDAEYSINFNCSKDMLKQMLLLDLGGVSYACEVFLNGKNIGKKAWRPFVFPVKGVLKEGVNKLRIIVTNTLANRLTSPEVLKDWKERKDPGWKLGPYQERQIQFELDSRASGLLGPVRLFKVRKV